MTSIHQLPPGSSPSNLPLEKEAELKLKQQGGGVSFQPGPETISQKDLIKLTQELNKGQPDVPGVINDAGAAAIPVPNGQMSLDTMLMVIAGLQVKTDNARIKTAESGIKLSTLHSEQLNKKIAAQLDEIAKKTGEAAKADKAGSICNWIGKSAGFAGAVAAVVIAALATVATGGAAAPLLGLAILGAVTASISLASSISQAAGGPALELSSWMPKLFSGALESLGIPKDKAESMGKLISGLVALTGVGLLLDPSLLGNLASGAAELAGADKALSSGLAMGFSIGATLAVSIGMMIVSGQIGGVIKAISGVGNFIAAGRIAQAISGITTGTNSIAAGAYKIEGGIKRKQADDVQAANTDTQAILSGIQKAVQQNQSDFEALLKSIQENLDVVSNTLNSFAQSGSTIAKNVSGRPQNI